MQSWVSVSDDNPTQNTRTKDLSYSTETAWLASFASIWISSSSIEWETVDENRIKWLRKIDYIMKCNWYSICLVSQVESLSDISVFCRHISQYIEIKYTVHCSKQNAVSKTFDPINDLEQTRFIMIHLTSSKRTVLFDRSDSHNIHFMSKDQKKNERILKKRIKNRRNIRDD